MILRGDLQNRFVRERWFQRRIVVGTRFNVKINFFFFFCYETFFPDINIEEKHIYTDILSKLKKKKPQVP